MEKRCETCRWAVIKYERVLWCCLDEPLYEVVEVLPNDVCDEWREE